MWISKKEIELKERTHEIRENILKHELAASAGVFYEINLTKDLVPGTMYQILDGKEYSINEEIGFPENCKFSDVVRYWGEHRPKEDQEEFYRFFDRERLMKCYEEGQTHVSYEYWTKNWKGNRLYAQQHIEMYEDPQNGDILGMTYIIDGTDIQALRRQELRNMEIINSMSVLYSMVYYIDLKSNHFTEINCEVIDIREKVGREGKAQETLNFYCDTIVVPQYREEMKKFFDHSTIVERLKSTPFVTTEYERYLSDGSTNWIRAIYTVCERDPQEEITHIVLSAENIDEQKRRELKQQERLEQALAASEAYTEELKKAKQAAEEAYIVAEHANQAKTNFLNSMSHDIRTPMNAILGFTALASTHVDQPEVITDYLGKIMASSNHLLSLINDVLDMSRIESGKLKIEEKECNLSVAIHDLRNMLQADIKDKRLDFFIDTVDVMDENVICDRLRLNQILINIMSNAIKFTNPGGAVSLRVIQKGTAPEGYADFEFIIRDNGIGMSEEFVSHIFEPFSREENSTVSGIPGTGLGMAITKNLVDMMHGQITVKSEPGRGSEFTVSVRFLKGNHFVEKRGIKNLEGFRALVADDSTDACISTSKMLKVIGMRADWTTSGKEAVIRAQLASEEKDEYKVYIIDWLMPDMNGIEVVRRIRRVIGDETPIIILTAYDWSDIEMEAKEAGVTAFCAKPLFLSELYSILQETSDPSYEEPKSKPVELNEFKGKRILLVEDVELNREIAETILDEAGILVETAENGEIAVKKMESAASGYYDLILMDVMMPVMDGYEATRRIRKLPDERNAKIPIIAMTANAFEEDRAAALEAGMNEHLAKPFRMEALYEAMHKFMK